MGRSTFSNATYRHVHDKATGGGAKSATADAEHQARSSKTLDPRVDPKGFAHLRGPIRMSLPRFEEQPSGLWQLTVGIPIPVESLLDTTGSMGNNVDIAIAVLPHFYELLASGKEPVLRGYDVQVANAVFGDVQDVEYVGADGFAPVLCRSQFEMDVKIAEQLTLMVTNKNGCGNGKEDPQYGLFGAAYLTDPTILKYGLKGYHFTVSDEPFGTTVSEKRLIEVFGDDVRERVKEMGFEMTKLPHTEEMIRVLRERTHAFFLQVGNRGDVTEQWTHAYGKEHVVMLPDGTRSLHLVEGVIIGLTEGVIGLSDAKDWLEAHGADMRVASEIVRAVSHIPLGEQRKAENYGKLPKAGALFKEKTDLWPLTADELVAYQGERGAGEKKNEKIDWL